MNAAEPREELIRPIPADARPSLYSLALNALPLCYVLAGVAVVIAIDGIGMAIAAALAWIYVVPPLIARIAMALFGVPQGEALDQASRAYKVWWFLAQLQIPFNRFGVFEELIRLVPGLYPLWLNAWGSRVSSIVYWGPGAMVADRQSARIGRGAVIGTRAVLSGHLAVKDESGATRVTLGPVEIGEGVLIGAYAGIGPGCIIAPGEQVPAAAYVRPYTRWANGRRIKPRQGRLA